jgi:3-phenylpropionate/cinnamic acid dioxygenase small subunit
MASIRLEDIADRLEIDDLLTRYATGLDTKDWDLWASCFVDDAFIDYESAGGIKGTKAEIRAWLAKTFEMFPMTQHVVGNRVIAIDGDRATARSAFYNPMGLPDGEGGMKLFFDGGYYNDKLVRTAEGWKIEERIEESSYSTLRMPTLKAK